MYMKYETNMLLLCRETYNDKKKHAWTKSNCRTMTKKHSPILWSVPSAMLTEKI